MIQGLANVQNAAAELWVPFPLCFDRSYRADRRPNPPVPGCGNREEVMRVETPLLFGIEPATDVEGCSPCAEVANAQELGGTLMDVKDEQGGAVPVPDPNQLPGAVAFRNPGHPATRGAAFRALSPGLSTLTIELMYSSPYRNDLRIRTADPGEPGPGVRPGREPCGRCMFPMDPRNPGFRAPVLSRGGAATARRAAIFDVIRGHPPGPPTSPPRPVTRFRRLARHHENPFLFDVTTSPPVQRVGAEPGPTSFRRCRSAVGSRPNTVTCRGRDTSHPPGGRPFLFDGWYYPNCRLTINRSASLPRFGELQRLRAGPLS